jgi:predicted nucleic acid-binding protein
MNPKSAQVALVDTGFWFAFFDKKDQYHARAEEYAELITGYRLVVPWPTLYETLRSRFLRQPITARKRVESLLRPPQATLLDDAPYRETALKETFSPNGKAYSIVDNVLRLILADVKIRIDVMFTVNHADFRDVCSRRSIEMV